MAIVLDPDEPAISRGIRTVGIGKKGSQNLTPELAREIVDELRSGSASDAAKGAFFAGLCAKGIDPAEEILDLAFVPGTLKESSKLLEAITAGSPDYVKDICGQLLAGQTLDKDTAYKLGQFLFSGDLSDGARGWVASFLRVRYESDDEYAGLLQAMHDTLAPAFKILTPPGEPVVQIAEPFDGVDHSYMITPLLGRALQGKGYRVVHQVGRNSGPKLEMNLQDLALALGETAALSNADLALQKPQFGFFFHQSLMSRAMDRWIGLRRQIIKRPFLATLERFINPLKAEILIVSAFHAPYGEKMLAIAGHAGFTKIIIVRNGIEGTIGFPLLRDVKLLLAARQEDGTFLRKELVIENHPVVDTEEMIAKPKVSANAGLIQSHVKTGTSGNKHFDLRVKLTCKGINRALEWLS
jgi:anthranilate phosphoribosyltransferase